MLPLCNFLYQLTCTVPVTVEWIKIKDKSAIGNCRVCWCVGITVGNESKNR